MKLVGALIGLAALAALGYVAARALTPAAPVEPVTTIYLRGVALHVPTPFLRPDALGASAPERVTLEAFFPDFSPAGSGADIGPKTDLTLRFAKVVAVAIEPAGDDVAPAERVAKLYLRFLDDKELPSPTGLTARAFKDDSPFAGDTLFYSAPEGADFAARCPNAKPDAAAPATCSAAFRVDGLDVAVRFPAPLIGEWSAIKSGALGLVDAARR